MADECTDVATIEASHCSVTGTKRLFCCCEEEGLPEEHLFCSSAMLEREKSSGEQNCWNGV